MEKKVERLRKEILNNNRQFYGVKSLKEEQYCQYEIIEGIPPKELFDKYGVEAVFDKRRNAQAYIDWLEY